MTQNNEESKIVEFNKDRITTTTEEITEEIVVDEYGNDTILEEGKTHTVAVEHNEEEYLSFAVIGLYKDEEMTKQKTRLEMRTDPPFLEISSSTGDEVRFPLTYQFNQSMIGALDDVNYAYLGIKGAKERDLSQTEKRGFTQTLNENKVLILELFLGVVIGMFITKGYPIPTAVAFLISIVVVFRAHLPLPHKTNDKDDIDTNDKNNEEVE